jgi:hypothetical protein
MSEGRVGIKYFPAWIPSEIFFIAIRTDYGGLQPGYRSIPIFLLFETVCI